MTRNQLDSLQELVVSTRELMLAVGTTELPSEELDSLRGEVDALAAKIGAARRAHVVRAGFEAPARAKVDGKVWHSFANNPFAIPMDLVFEDRTARATLRANALHEGPPGCLHGGLAAHVMDCILGTMIQANGYRARTGTLDIRYVRPTPLDAPLELFGEIERSSGRKHFARGTIRHNGEVTVEATALFVEVAPQQPQEDGSR